MLVRARRARGAWARVGEENLCVIHPLSVRQEPTFSMELPPLRVTLSTLAVAIIVGTYLLRRRKKHRILSHAETTALIANIMRERAPLPSGQLGSESSHPLLTLPAVLGKNQRLLLGDVGHVAEVIEGDDNQDGARRCFYKEHPVGSILVCMGSAAARAIARDLDKRGIAYLGLDGCVDEEGYEILAHHLRDACAFIRRHVQSPPGTLSGGAAGAPSGGPAAGSCCLVHCKEGKNRSACLCVAYLMVEERMPLVDAVQHVFSLRPIVLDNASFVAQVRRRTRAPLPAMPANQLSSARKAAFGAALRLTRGVCVSRQLIKLADEEGLLPVE